MTLKLNECRKEKIKCELKSSKSCPGREQGNCECVQILPYNFCDDCRWWQGDILWLLSWPRHKPNIKGLFAEIVFLLRLSAVSVNALFLSPSFTFCSYRRRWWVLYPRCSSVECQPRKFSLKISLLPHLSSLFCLWVTSGVLAEVSRQLCTAPDSPRAAGWSDQRGRLSCFVFAECRFLQVTFGFWGFSEQLFICDWLAHSLNVGGMETDFKETYSFL